MMSCFQTLLSTASCATTDREYYDNPAHAGEVGNGVDIGKYVAGGIYVVDLKTLVRRCSFTPA